MTEGPLFVNIMRFTVPIIITNMLQLMFNATDIIMVGRMCGSESVAAVGATGSVTQLLVNLFIGIALGAGVTVAQGVGARDNDEVHKAVHTAMTASVICVCGVRLTWVFTVFAAHHTLNTLFLSYSLSWSAAIIAQTVVFIAVKRRITQKAKLAAPAAL